MTKPNINPDRGPAREPVRVMAQWDGNLTRNYSNNRNVRVADHVHYGDGDGSFCPGCDAQPESADA